MRLEDIGLQLPRLPTTSVGSLAKPDGLKKARTAFRKGKIDRDELKQLEDEATLFWIKKQEEIGIDVIVDGEMYRGDMVEYFAEHIEGFALSGLVRSYGNRYYHKPIIRKALVWNEPITVSHWKFAQQNSSRPVKGMLTGPYTIMDWSFLEYYKERKEATYALADIVRKEVQALVDAGAKIIQIDEPALSTRFDEVEWALDALRVCSEGFNCYFITHACYGEFSKIYDDILKLPVDNLDIEMSNSNLDLLNLFKTKPLNKDISFGVVDVHDHKLEPHEVIKARIKQAIEALGPEHVWIDPDCGLKTRSVDESVEILSAIVKATKELRAEITK